MKSTIQQLVNEKRNAHILYAYTGNETYFRELYQYISDGIHAGDHLLLVENERISSQVQKELAKRFSSQQLNQVHYVNSLHFYWSSGSYNPQAIQAYFTEVVAPFIEKGHVFRSWAHVEWESVKEPLHLIEEFEYMVDQAVNEMNFPLICAYGLDQMPERLQTMLLKTHPYVLEDASIAASTTYEPQ
ncbi:hypothetical protein CQS04_10035 [Chryseomicrobium excrementi]|uniref:MEDS domain-containing protein n=1 Tax=Chryseomicrobium excrementi TaxID=2041346 RepID=A0A2M9EYF6_9BACL|nr:MEDS domain-containing protein [Chryseomicrobium excrementi]PJK16238.1 hypothetical protein CQS04_10035 [Chryseomicrobium excrementi]